MSSYLLRVNRLAASLAAGLLAAACSSDRPGPTQASPEGRFPPAYWVGGDPVPGAVQVCVYGPDGTYTYDLQTHDGAGNQGVGTFPLGNPALLQAGQCDIVWQDDGSAPKYNVRVTQIGTPPNTQADSAVGFTTEGFTQETTDLGPSLVFDFLVGGTHSGSARFYNSESHLPPAPQDSVTVCKEGPAGTYNFTISASGGTVGTLPFGSAFTLANGECKTVWLSNPPVSDPDPAVTVIIDEVGPLPPNVVFDSVAGTADSGGDFSQTTSLVTFYVNAWHGAVATYYNRFVPPPPPPPVCNGLTPGYWKNWRNHYTEAEFSQLLVGTIAGSIAEADAIFAKLGGKTNDPIVKLKWFVLANQLTLNLTGTGLPNPSNGELVLTCLDPQTGEELGDALATALQILADPSAYTRGFILEIKDILDRIANLIDD
jgi:hypothetical protein